VDADTLSGPSVATPKAARAPTRAAFAGRVFDVARDELSHDGAPIALGPKARVLLKYLLDHPERVVGKEELLAALWGTTVVTENSLVQLVLELRNALDDREQRIVKTVPRRGYMLVAPVEWQHDRPRTTPVVRARARWQVAAGAAALLCVAAALTLRVTPAPYSVDADYTGSFPVSIAPLIEADIDGEPSSLGRRIAGDIETSLVRYKTPVRTPPEGARFVISGRLLRRGVDGLSVDTQLKDLVSGGVYPLVTATFNSEDDAVRSDLPLRVYRALVHRREAVVLAQAQRPGHQPNGVELLYMAWNDYNLAASEADLERAGARFQDVLRIDPTSVFARVGRSVVCLQMFTRLHSASPVERLDTCERLIRELYARAPENLDAMQAMAGLLTWRGKADEAIWLLRKSLELSPLHRMGNPMMASVLVKQGRFDDAAPYMETTRSWAERRTEHGPSDKRRQAYIYQLFADAAFLQGRDGEAREWLRRWAAEMPDNGRPYLMLAAMDALQDRGEEARANMARHRELLPRSTVRYVGMLYPLPSSEAIQTARARLLDGARKAGLPEGD